MIKNSAKVKDMIGHFTFQPSVLSLVFRRCCSCIYGLQYTDNSSILITWVDKRHTVHTTFIGDELFSSSNIFPCKIKAF